MPLQILGHQCIHSSSLLVWLDYDRYWVHNTNLFNAVFCAELKRSTLRGLKPSEWYFQLWWFESNSCMMVCTSFGTTCAPVFNAQLKPVPTKWETSHKISLPSYYQIHVVQNLSFKIILWKCLPYRGPQPLYSGLLPHLGSKTYYFFAKFLCFQLMFVIFNEPYLL